MFEDVYNALVDALLFIPRVLFWLFIDAVSIFFPTIGEGIGTEVAQSLLTFNSGNFGYFVEVTQINTGISLSLSALIIRFIIRRLPFIG